MKALTYHGPGIKAWEDVPAPTITDPGDIIVKTLATTICGTDLGILHGKVPDTPLGTTFGHESVGIVTEVGSQVTKHQVGDRVLVSCISSCGNCSYCSSGVAAHCQAGGGWILGHHINGTIAEYVRVPFADKSAYTLPEHVASDEALMLSDIFPTGYEIGVLKGTVKQGDVVAVVGAGPVGLSAIATAAALKKPAAIIAIDLDPNRLNKAKALGATHGISASEGDWKEQVLALTDGLGVDVALEAVGLPQTWDTALALVRPGGHLAVIGVHGKPVNFPLEECWIRNLTITTGLVSAVSTPELLGKLVAGQLDTSAMITHRFSLSQIDAAWDVFENAAASGSIKVLLEADA